MQRADGARRRAAVLEGALKVFVERGLLGTGIEEIRKAAGASPSSVYHLFPAGRDGVIAALLLRTFAALFGQLTARVARAATAEAAVRALVRGHVDWVLHHPEEARFMYQATASELSPAASSELLAEKARHLAPIAHHLSRFVAEGALPRWPLLELEVVIMGATHEACRRYLAGAPLSRRWLRETLPELAWRSLAATPRAPGSARRASRRRAPDRRG